MSRNSDVSNVSRRRFLAVAGGMAAANSFVTGEALSSAVPPPPPPTTYLVTVDIRTNPISYTYTTTSGGGVHKANRLKVNEDDIVKWKVTTPLTTLYKYHMTIFCVRDTPLADTNGNPVFAIHGSEVDADAGRVKAKIDSDTSGSYEYYVAVTDDATGKTYTDDPKIIVGGSGTFEQRDELIKDAHQLIAEARKLEDAAGSNHALKEKIESIERELGEVVVKLEQL
jgi:hypothetical protein